MSTPPFDPDMTLDEYVAQLPSNHPASIEYTNLCTRVTEVEACFDLHQKMSIRAIKAWQKAHPEKDFAWPDTKSLIGWLLERIDGLELQRTSWVGKPTSMKILKEKINTHEDQERNH